MPVAVLLCCACSSSVGSPLDKTCYWLHLDGCSSPVVVVVVVNVGWQLIAAAESIANDLARRSAGRVESSRVEI